jgi:uncharacterized membrane protein
MDLQALLDICSRIVHVATAIAITGGTVFMTFVLLPVAGQLSEEEHQKLRTALQHRWKRWVHVGILFFLVTGLYNFIRALPDHRGDGLYHGLVGTKILLALVVFFIASALVGRSAAFEKMRSERQRWLRILVFLAAAIVAISGFVKVRGKPSERAADSAAP